MIYKVTKDLEISAAHNLNLSYESPCQSLHGHNWNIKISCLADKLNTDSMVIDFKLIKELIHEKLDHGYLNEILGSGINPTAENIGAWIIKTINDSEEFDNKYSMCYRVEVQESSGNTAIVIDDTILRSYGLPLDF